MAYIKSRNYIINFKIFIKINKFPHRFKIFLVHFYVNN